MTSPILERRPAVMGIERRLFLRQTLSLGALTLLTGCDISDQDAVQSRAATSVALERPGAGLPVQPRRSWRRPFPRAPAVRDFRYNACFPMDQAPKLDAADYRLELAGLIANKRPWTVDAALRLAAGKPDHAPCLRRGLEHDRQMERHAAARLPASASAPTSPRSMSASNAPTATTRSIDMPTALHPQTIMAFRLRRRDPAAEIRLSVQDPHPDQARLQEPEIRHHASIVTNRMPGGFWTDRGYNWFSGF